MAKLEWALEKGRADGHPPHLLSTGDLWGAAAASGDLARVRWLRENGFSWGGEETLAVVMRHANLACIVRMDEEGGYLPPAGDPSWSSSQLAPAAAPHATAPPAVLTGGPGVEVGTLRTVEEAALHGNLAALQLALQHWRQQQPQQQEEEEEEAVPLRCAMVYAVRSGHVPTAAWLHQAGCGLQFNRLFKAVVSPGHLHMLRWLLESGCPVEGVTLTSVAEWWPSHKPADGERLLEALQLLAEAGVPAWDGEATRSLQPATRDTPGLCGTSWSSWLLSPLCLTTTAERLPRPQCLRATRWSSAQSHSWAGFQALTLRLATPLRP